MEFYLRRNTSTFKDKVVVYFFPSAPILDLRGKFYFLPWSKDNRVHAHVSLIVGSTLCWSEIEAQLEDKYTKRVWEFFLS